MEKWKEIIKTLHGMKTAHDHLKPAFLAQWMLETGRGTSVAFKEFWNVAGMKWRPEMEGHASKVWYKTDSETYRNGPNGWEKGDWFCAFPGPVEAINGYFRFLSRAPYHGWEQHSATAMDFLSFIGPTWCPYRYKEDNLFEGGLNYHQHIVEQLFPEAKQLLGELGEIPEDVPGTVTWFECAREESGKAVITAITGMGRAVSQIIGAPAIQKDELSKFLDNFQGASNILVAPEDKPIPDAPAWPDSDNGNAPTPPPSHLPLKGIPITLDPGHSMSSQGAHGLGSNPPQEYEMNALQARIVAQRLRDAGAVVKIFDPDPDNLTRVGLSAQGAKVYVALHHNAANKDGNDEGTETHIHPKANSDCFALARTVNDKIVHALGTRDRGVKRSAFTVLSVSHHDTDCDLNILTESYFIDDYRSKETTRKRSTKAAHAIADGIIEFLSGQTPEPLPIPEGNVLEPWEGVRKFNRNDNVQLSKNFHLSEFRCRCGCKEVLVDGRHITELQKFRDKLGKPTRITSGYRCPSHNEAVGGAKDSQHMKGTASDIVVDGISPAVVYANADKQFDGVGRYRTFTHVDSRGYKARW